MIIDYISDLHEDYFLDNLEITEESVKEFFEPLLPKGEICLIAGDTSENNERLFKTLHYLKKVFNYNKIFFVLGNHELYTRGFYPTFQDKIENLKELLKEDKDLVLLDGEVVNYKGVRIGGTMMWYDGSYSKFFELDEYHSMNKAWYDNMPDADAIDGLNYYKYLFNVEIKKLKKIYRRSDIIMTHVPPLCDPMFVHPEFRAYIQSAFFYFNGHKYIKKTKAKHWVCGHTHIPLEIQYANTKIHCNPKGYKREATRKLFKQIEI